MKSSSLSLTKSSDRLRPPVENISITVLEDQVTIPKAHEAFDAEGNLVDASQQGADIPLDGASDYGTSEALYLRDPDENGVELYWDRPQEEWPRTAEGGVNMFAHPLDLESLLAENKS